MKITIDTKKNLLKAKGKNFDELSEFDKNIVVGYLEKYRKLGQLTDWEEDLMYMAYRYAIGRQSIGAHSLACEIKENCYGRMSEERSIFNAFDMNREVERCLHFHNLPNFWFPLTSLNSIYTSALDIFCQFVEDFNIQTKEELLKYKDVHIKLADNERGYSLEVVTWEEVLRPQVWEACKKFYNNEAMGEELAWQCYQDWLSNGGFGELGKTFTNITKPVPDPEHFYLSDIDALFIWNDLVHIFDVEHHHKSILTDGTECEWVWSYAHDTYQKDGEPDHYYQKEIGYKRIRIPVDKWNGVSTIYIPDENIKKDLY